MSIMKDLEDVCSFIQMARHNPFAEHRDACLTGAHELLHKIRETLVGRENNKDKQETDDEA